MFMQIALKVQLENLLSLKLHLAGATNQHQQIPTL